ncbi:MAG: hypothetical protein M3Q03_05020 [Chloroflexota bacterium]|nr:hypothetical protein [Chloroflexota bacterium]
MGEMVDDVVGAMRARYGTDWGTDDEANLRFSVDAEHLVRDVAGAHLIGEAEVEDGAVTLTLWVEAPIPDLMAADQLAYDVFARLSEDLFYVERRFEAKAVRYPFVTGSASHGHVGALILAGPHAADFADRHHARVTGSVRYHA